MTDINPWQVKSEEKINYLKVIERFGCKPITGETIKRFESITGHRAHKFLRRGVFFAEKDLDKILTEFEQGNPIFLYTGRGPSSEAMHLGHMIPFMFTKWLQDVFGAVLVICMSDDEKFFFKDGELDDFNHLTYQNARDIIACGFNPNKTFIYSNLEFMGGRLYNTTARIMRAMTGNTMRGIYGLNLDNNIGQLVWPSMQASPAFYQSFPEHIVPKGARCLVSMAIDQSPYFRMARDFASNHRQFIKPAEINGRFLPSLRGINDKMSSSTIDATMYTIFLTDDFKTIETKMMKYSFSGGRASLAEHRQIGGNLEIDVAYQYLCYFLDDDTELEHIAREYKSGRMTSSEIKRQATNCVSEFIRQHQERLAQIDDASVSIFFNQDREFDHSFPVKPPSNSLTNDDNYDCYGINYDLLFEKN